MAKKRKTNFGWKGGKTWKAFVSPRFNFFVSWDGFTVSFGNDATDDGMPTFKLAFGFTVSPLRPFWTRKKA